MVGQSSLIRSETLLNFLLAACWRAKEEMKVEKGDNILSQKRFDVKDNHILLLYIIFVNKNLL